MVYVGVFFHLHRESQKMDIRVFDLVRWLRQRHGNGDGTIYKDKTAAVVKEEK